MAVSQPNRETSHYVQQEFAENYPPGVEHAYWHLARNAIIAENLRTIGARKVLDVGCGRGIVVEYLNTHGIDCFGVEPGDVIVPTNLAGKIYQGVTAQQLDESVRRAFDTILLGDVIEHIEHPESFLIELQKLYPNVRHFVIMVPARHELWSNYDEHYGHYRRYDLATLRTAMQTSGLQVVSIGYFFKLLYPLMRLILLIRRQRSTQLRASVGGRTLHRFLAALLVADYHWLPARIYGTSLICIAAVPR